MTADLPSPSVEGGEPTTDPILADNGYPSEQELQRIRDWPWEDGFRSLMAYVRERWQYADVGYWEQHGDRFEISTGGWSGNESIIGALEENQMFSMLCSWSWRRGGHYVYDVREWAEQGGKRVLVQDPATPAEARAGAVPADLDHQPEAFALLRRWRDASLDGTVSDLADLTDETTGFLDEVARLGHPGESQP